MSNIVTLKTEKSNRFGKSVILGGIEVKFDVFGLTDVVERHAETLIASGLIPVDKEDIEKYKELREKYEESGSTSIPEIDYIDENTKLKAKLEVLTKENKELKEMLEKSLKSVKTEEIIEKTEVGDDNLDISKMGIDELKSACKESGLAEKEWKNLKIDALRSYLTKKLED